MSVLQDIALLDARRGVTMFNRISVPNLGIVENMSYHQCKSCGHKEFVFGENGALQTAEELSMEVLGQACFLPSYCHIRSFWITSIYMRIIVTLSNMGDVSSTK